MKKNNDMLNLSKAQEALLNNPEISRTAKILSNKHAGCCGRALQVTDLYNEALIGAAYAAKVFSPDANTEFKTLAEKYMLTYILRVIQQHGCPFKLNKEEREQLRIISLDAQLFCRILPKDDPEDDAGGLTVADALPDDEDASANLPSPEQLLARLSTKERMVVELVHGLNKPAVSMRKAAAIMKVTPQRARQIYNRAIAKLQLC